MYQPITTYRIQFHQKFTFQDFRKVIPYLQQLGIRTIYASPIFESVAGSTHGYDQVNPLRINPEIGTLEELEEIHQELKKLGIGWLQDIVPNHMAFDFANKWLMDVLEKGKDSPYVGYFDFPLGTGEPWMVPFLGKPLKEVLQNRELKLVRQEGRWAIQYYQAFFPLSEQSIQSFGEEQLRQAQEQPELLEALLAQQHYRLCHWQETNSRINYRRFFTVNGLICLNAQDEKVMDATHAFALSLLRQQVFQGLRVDHIDGLLDPVQYLYRLREKAGDEAYIVVEKILEQGEALPMNWPVQGTTGYGFLAQLNKLLTWPKSKVAFTRLYARLTGKRQSVDALLLKKKEWMLYHRMQGELDNLTKWFLELVPDLPFELAKKAVALVLMVMPQYRFYGNRLPLGMEETAAMRALFHQIRDEDPALQMALFQLERTLLDQPLKGEETCNQKALHFYQRLMQLSGPLMAKGMEDTLMYVYNRFIGHNEVGDSPESFGMTVAAYHELMLDRAKHWPLALNATETHDTKRGEDARAMLQVLPSIPDAWQAAVTRWSSWNEAIKESGAPDANEAYFIYQTLFATWPLREEEVAGFSERLKTYLIKALREAKEHTDWSAPDEDYENSVQKFALQLMDAHHPFFNDFLTFRKKYEDFGMLNALVQVLLKCTCPGVPDVYQGSELWDQSLVDPDNRRPVDYTLRQEWLNTLKGRDWQSLWAERHTGAIKLQLLQSLVTLRSDHPELFAQGAYVPLTVTGKHAAHVIAFARNYKEQWLMVLAGLHLPLISEQVEAIDWLDTRVQLPPAVAAAWQQMEKDLPLEDGAVALQHLMKPLPMFFKVIRQEEKKRGAGILAAISSLPGYFGMGDFGPEAHRFASLLGRMGWRYWQLLPLTPVSAGTGYSPYSSCSTLAGNPLFISPELLAAEGLLDQATLRKHHLSAGPKVDFVQAEAVRNTLLHQAWQRYQQGGFPELSSRIATFTQEEAWWLDDFALYAALKEHFKGKPWFEWPDEIRQRNKAALGRFASAHPEAIAYYKWQQALFAFQLRDLRIVCQQQGIQLIGDLPFYASYDSADVWSHPEFFSVNEAGAITGVAGVPPDYFSETGQLWGMPTFRWDALAAEGYQWWIRRLKKNLEAWDLLRIDHFRALAAYWEVPAGEATAMNGQWLKGPGVAFFRAVEAALGSLPFIAEDLGDNMADVYRLRDEVDLPGMTVLQFAFGADLPDSIHAPHNYRPNTIAYTGTHDNNTILGWYRSDASEADKVRLHTYAGQQLSEKNLPAVMARLTLGSVARIAILPLQDVLGLDERSRMNTPGTGSNNWSWRLEKPITVRQLAWVRPLLQVYGRS